MDNPVIAASTQRQIGYVITGIVLLAMAVYWLFNWLEGRHETGAEIELAANRKEAMSDEEMETKRLDLSLTGGLVTLTIIALALPLYWLGEPGRQEGLVDFTDTPIGCPGCRVVRSQLRPVPWFRQRRRWSCCRLQPGRYQWRVRRTRAMDCSFVGCSTRPIHVRRTQVRVELRAAELANASVGRAWVVAQ